MGGYGSWLLTAAYPQRFAAMISTSGSGFASLAPTTEQICKVSGTPIWAFHGAKDMISDPFASKSYVVTLQTQCEHVAEVKWTLYPDAGHGETYYRAYRDPEIYTWLLSHSLDE
jgi:predicted peptidase